MSWGLAKVAWLILGDLPPEHPLRNAPLAQISAEYQWTNTRNPVHWNRVTKSSTIAKNTFNELGASWTESYRWRVDELTEVARCS